MRFNPGALCALALLVLDLGGAVVRPLAAQSLADLARKEDERRKNLKEAAKVIPNRDRSAVPPSSEAAPAAPAGSESSTANPGEAGKDAQKDTETDKAK